MAISTTVFLCRHRLLRRRFPSRMHCDRVSGSATKDGVPHISLVFREMWDTTALYQGWFGVQNLETGFRGIPHLAKNQRDVGHPSFVAGPEMWLAMAPAACRRTWPPAMGHRRRTLHAAGTGRGPTHCRVAHEDSLKTTRPQSLFHSRLPRCLACVVDIRRRHAVLRRLIRKTVEFAQAGTRHAQSRRIIAEHKRVMSAKTRRGNRLQVYRHQGRSPRSGEREPADVGG